MTPHHTHTEQPTLALDLIAPSPTNPRRRQQNEASNLKAWKLEELAESIRQHGVKSPIIVRPNPQHTEGDGRPPYELIAGERRWRASQLAGVPTIPYTLEAAMTDFDVLLLQVVENIQREDLHPLEEAEHYEKLMRAPNGLQGFATADDLAVALGKSRRFVYNRLALLKLGPAAREACYAGQISASVGLELANAVPEPTQQAKALKELIQGWAGEPYSARQAAAHLKKTYMLRLDRARFTTAEPLAGACACVECPKRTGANPDFFTDVKEGDLCLDATCYQAKTTAAHEALLQAARDEGATVISGEGATKLMRAGATKPHGFQLLDQPCIAFSDHPKPLRAAAGDKIAPSDMVFIDVPNSDAPVIVVSDAVAQRALKAKGLLKITAPVAPAPKKASKAKDGGAPLLAPVAAPNAPRVVQSTMDPLRDDPTDALFEGLLNFEVVPKASARTEAALANRRDTALTKARALLMAQALSRHMRSHDESGLPDDLAGLLLQQLIYSDVYVTVEVAAQMLDIEELLPPNRSHDQLLEWALHLDTEAATRMVILLLALQDPGPVLSMNGNARATGAALALDVDAVEAAAAAHVDQRLQLDLVKHGTPAAKGAGKKLAAAKPAVMYRCAATGSTWSGRGLQPKWLKVALADGKKLADFAA